MADSLLRLIVDEGVAGADQMLRPGIKLLEIVGRIMQVRPPVEAKPAHVALDGVDKFLLLPSRIGVVETQMAAACKLFGDAEIQSDRLRMPEMQLSFGPGRKARHHPRVLSGGEVSRKNVADEVGARVWHRLVVIISFKPRPMHHRSPP